VLSKEKLPANKRQVNYMTKIKCLMEMGKQFRAERDEVTAK